MPPFAQLGTVPAQVPAGNYVIGDPSYLFTDAQFEELRQLASFQRHSLTAARLGQHAELCVLWRTAYGDGLYPCLKAGQLRCEVAVDSGLLCLVELAALERLEVEQPQMEETLLRQSKPAFFLSRFAAPLSLEQPSELRMPAAGDLELGPYKVHTSSSETPTYESYQAAVAGGANPDIDIDARVPYATMAWELIALMRAHSPSS